MNKWIVAVLLGFVLQGSSMDAALATSQHAEPIASKEHGRHYGRFASYWLTNQPSLVDGQNVQFNLQQTRQGIEYDPSTGIFTLPAGVYAINFFGTPNLAFENTLNLNVNGTIIPTPSLEGSTIVVQFSDPENLVSVQATGNWSPQTDELGTFFFAYASIDMYQIGSGVAP
jgi:hypothetical protein